MSAHFDSISSIRFFKEFQLAHNSVSSYTCYIRVFARRNMLYSTTKDSPKTTWQSISKWIAHSSELLTLDTCHCWTAIDGQLSTFIAKTSERTDGRTLAILQSNESQLQWNYWLTLLIMAHKKCSCNLLNEKRRKKNQPYTLLFKLLFSEYIFNESGGYLLKLLTII